MVVMVAMVVKKLTFKLDSPGNLCLVAFAILAMFFLSPPLPLPLPLSLSLSFLCLLLRLRLCLCHRLCLCFYFLIGHTMSSHPSDQSSESSHKSKTALQFLNKIHLNNVSLIKM